MILGVGSFAHSIGQTLADAGASVSTYLTRNYGHFPPTLAGKTFSQAAFPNPAALVRENKIECRHSQSIDWALQPWAKDLLKIRRFGIFLRPARRCGLNANATLLANFAPNSKSISKIIRRVKSD